MGFYWTDEDGDNGYLDLGRHGRTSVGVVATIGLTSGDLGVDVYLTRDDARGLRKALKRAIKTNKETGR